MTSPFQTIASRANPRIKQLRAAASGNPRLAEGLIAIEGDHLIAEALRSNLPLETLFLAEHRNPPSNLPETTQLLRCTAEALQSALTTQSPQGIAALLRPPRWTLEVALTGDPLLLIAVGLQDPGNLGTIIRSAEAFAATAVLLTPGTVDPWNPKALRASAGSTFRLPTIPITEADIPTLKAHYIRLLAAVAGHHHAVPASMAGIAGPCALLIGNEGAGLPAKWLIAADDHITIPCPGPVESLNAAVAASLLLYEASRQRGAR